MSDEDIELVCHEGGTSVWRRKSDGRYARAPNIEWAREAYADYDSKPESLKDIQWGKRVIGGDQVTGFDYEKELVQLSTVTNVWWHGMRDKKYDNRRWVRPEDCEWADG